MNAHCHLKASSARDVERVYLQATEPFQIRDPDRRTEPVMLTPNDGPLEALIFRESWLVLPVKSFRGLPVVGVRSWQSLWNDDKVTIKRHTKDGWRDYFDD